MNAPDYSKYSLSELYEALRTVDEEAYPERAERIRDEIRRRKRAEDTAESKKVQAAKEHGTKVDLSRTISALESSAIVLQIVSLLFGLGLFLSVLFGLNFSELGYSIKLSFPGSSKLSRHSLKILLILVSYPLNLSFVTSAIGSFFNVRFFVLLLAVNWAMMTFGFELWQFMWWPTPAFDQALGLRFNVFGLALGFKVNLLSSVFFIWSSLLVPEIHSQILHRMLSSECQ